MLRILGFILVITNLSLANSVMAASAEVPVGPDEVFIQGTADNEIKVMSYNLLNLFDAEKDVFSDDWQWLPINYPGKQQYCNSISDQRDRRSCASFDWTWEKVDLKLNQIQAVVMFQGSLPDVLAVVEIENENVLKLLAAKLGYQNYIITNSADKRGIDVAVLFNNKTNFNYVSWEPIHIKFASQRPGRDLMRVDFNWNGNPLSVYINHWPSQRNPTEERMVAAQAMAQNIEQMFQYVGPKWSAVTVGDFNTLETESPNPFNDVIYNSNWKNHLYDAELYGRMSQNNPSLPYTPPGSYYYVKEDVWNHLDRIAVTQNLMDGQGIEFAQESLRIPFPAFMSHMFHRKPGRNEGGSGRTLRVPKTYNFETSNVNDRGFSDHLPVVFKLRQN